MAKRAAFIGHRFHDRTKSSVFFQDMLREHFAVDLYEYDPDETNTLDYTSLLTTPYDYYFFWQTEAVAAQLQRHVTGQFVMIPMYDAAIYWENDFWKLFPTALFISFSAKLHSIVQSARCDSVHVQYFPKLGERQWDSSAPLSGFFWERRPGEKYDVSAILPAAAKLGLKTLHIHLAADTDNDPDEREQFIRTMADQKGFQMDFQFSRWFESKAEMHASARRHAIYFAPRSVEGIGMGVLEAMCSAQVIIGPDEPTLNEYVVDGSTGFFLDSEFTMSVSAPPNTQALLAMSENAQKAMRKGRTRWLEDRDRIMDAILLGRVNATSDRGAHFEKQLKVLAGSRP